MLDYLQIDKPDPVKQTVEYRSAAKRNEDMPRKLLDRFPAFDHSPRPVGGKKSSWRNRQLLPLISQKRMLNIPQVRRVSNYRFSKYLRNLKCTFCNISDIH